MRYNDLLEGGIPTALAHTKLRADLQAALPDKIKLMIDWSKSLMGFPDPTPKDEEEGFGEYNMRYIDALDAALRKGDINEQLATAFCKDLQVSFTRTARQTAEEQFQAAARKNHDFWSKYRIGVRASLDIKEYSKDPKAKNSGGYFSAYQEPPLIKCFIAEKVIMQALRDAISEHLFELGEGDPIDVVMNAVADIFTHEYAHYGQWLLNRGEYKDFGYITAGLKKRGKGKGNVGLRGGYHRSYDTEAAYLRYKGATHEIDSFASGAATEMVQTIRANSPYWNESIRDLQQSLAGSTGYNSRNYAEYVRLLRDTFDGHYEDSGLKPEQMVKVWKRFVRVVYQKLGHYLKDQAGKASDGASANLFRDYPQWVELARKAPRGRVFGMLAIWVARTEITHGSDYLDAEQRIQYALQGYCEKQYHAENFIEEFYFGNNFSGQFRVDEPYAMKEKNIEVFRRMVAAALTRMLERRKEDSNILA